jgi:hypothetical protein
MRNPIVAIDKATTFIIWRFAADDQTHLWIPYDENKTSHRRVPFPKCADNGQLTVSAVYVPLTNFDDPKPSVTEADPKLSAAEQLAMQLVNGYQPGGHSCDTNPAVIRV